MGAQRLAAAVVDRRKQLGMTSQPALSERTKALDDSEVQPGISVRHISNIETGKVETMHSTTMELLDAALEWPEGRTAELLYGRDEPPEPELQRLRDLEAQVAELRDLVATLIAHERRRSDE